MNQMHRTQIYLPKPLHQALSRQARAAGVTLSEVIRGKLQDQAPSALPDQTPTKMPTRFTRFLWSQDLDRMDATSQKQTIIVAAINYGELDDWRWLVAQYGKRGVAEVLQRVPSSAIRPQAARLAGLIFGHAGDRHAS